jgi:heat shock protein HslJ
MHAVRIAALLLGNFMLLACVGNGRADASAAEAPPATGVEDAALAPSPFDPTVLAGREWRLVSLPGPDAVPVPDTVNAVLRFEPQPDGSWRASGNGPCNQLMAPVAFAGDTIEFRQIGATKRACAELALETAWFDRMRAGKAAVKLDGTRLELSRDSVAVMVFEGGPAG